MTSQHAENLPDLWFQVLDDSADLRHEHLIDHLSKDLLGIIDRQLQHALDFDEACRDYVQRATAAGEPGWAAAGRAVWALGLWHTGDEDSALLQTVLSELDLRDERERPPHDPPGGPTGLNAAANNLGVIYTVMRAYELALPHFRIARDESLAHYGPHLWVQHVVDHANLSEASLRWALHLESVGRSEESVQAARESGTAAAELIVLADRYERVDARDLADALLIGARSVTEPQRIGDADKKRLQEICRSVLFANDQSEPIVLAVLARVCRLVGDLEGCRQAADTARTRLQPGDHDLIGSAAREVALMDDTQSPGWQYANTLASHAESARLRSVAGFRTRLNLFGLEQRLEKVSAERAHLQEELERVTRSEADLLRAATHDPLTGLPNRTLLRQRLDSALQTLRDGTADFAVAFVDLDDLKQINDRQGHATGDKVLQSVGQRLAGSVQPSDTVARLSGDEFVVVLSRVDEAFLQTWVEGINDLMSDTELGVSVSVGVCLARAGCERSAEAILKAADDQMYAAKRAGKGRAFLTEIT